MKKKKPVPVTVSIEKTYEDEQLAYVELLPAQRSCLNDLLQTLYDAGRIGDSSVFDRGDDDKQPLHGLPALLNYLMKEYDIPAEALKAVNEGDTKYEFSLPNPDDDGYDG